MKRGKQLNMRGKTVVLLGKPVLFSDLAQLQSLLDSHGGRLEQTVTRATDYVICNDPDSRDPDLQLALQYGVARYTETEFLSALWHSSQPPEKELFTGHVQMEGVGTFRVNAGVLEKFEGTGQVVPIPKGITQIGEHAFFGCETVRCVTIPEGVHTIEKNAFLNCSNLEEVSLAWSVKTIGNQAFMGNALRCVTIPRGVETIGTQAFCNCLQLEKVILESGHTRLGLRCFAFCQKLQQLELPEGLEELPDSAFYCCEMLPKAVLPKGLRVIGARAFASCYSLAELTVPDSLVEIEEEAFRDCPLQQLELPDSVQVIGQEAFAGCTDLRTLRLPRYMERINPRAFAQCTMLESVVSPQKLEDGAEDIFYGCRKLADKRGFLVDGTTLVTAFLDGIRELVIPEDITVIGDEALLETDQLERVVIPDGVTRIGRFVLCHNIQNANYDNLKFVRLPAHISALDTGTLWLDGKLRCLVAPGLTMAQLRDRHLTAPAAVGYLCNPELYTDPDICGSYERLITAKKKEILRILFQEDLVAGIAAYADRGKLTKRNFEEEFLQPAIRENAHQCVAFLMEWKHRHIREQEEADLLLEELEKDFFNRRDMEKLWKLVFAKDSCELSAYKGTEKSIMIPHRVGRRTVTALAAYALSPKNPYWEKVYGGLQRALREVRFFGGVARIGEGAFADCRELREIYFEEGTEILEDGVFRDCLQLKTVELPRSLQKLGSGVFEKCSALTQVALPHRVTTAGEGLFRWCIGLKDITLSGSLVHIPAQLCFGCRKLETLTLPEGVQTVGAEAFRWCFSLGQVQLPTTLQSIGPAAFYGCRPLRGITLPEGVTELGSEAFCECFQLEKAVLPASLRQIGPDAFCGCGKITVYAPAGSFAETYAKENHIPFQTL